MRATLPAEIVYVFCFVVLVAFGSFSLGACHAPPSMGFPRQEHQSGLPFLFPGDLRDSGIEPVSSALQADSYH